MNFLRLLNVVNSMSKSCSRRGCGEIFIHGHNVQGQPLCQKCGKEFRDVMDDVGPSEAAGMQPRGYLKEEIRRFMLSPKGEIFIPSILLPEDEPISAYAVLYDQASGVEVITSDEESSETSFDLRMKEIDKEFEARCTTFQDDINFVSTFRQRLATCDDETLKSLMRAAECHAMRHDTEFCDGCQDDNDEIELSHNTRGLGNVWLHVCKELNKNEN